MIFFAAFAAFFIFYVGTNLCLTFELVNGNKVPLSTQMCLKERFEEVARTAPQDDEAPDIIVIDLGKNVDARIKESYKNFLKNNSEVTLKLGKGEDEARSISMNFRLICDNEIIYPSNNTERKDNDHENLEKLQDG